MHMKDQNLRSPSKYVSRKLLRTKNLLRDNELVCNIQNIDAFYCHHLHTRERGFPSAWLPRLKSKHVPSCHLANQHDPSQILRSDCISNNRSRTNTSHAWSLFNLKILNFTDENAIPNQPLRPNAIQSNSHWCRYGKGQNSGISLTCHHHQNQHNPS